MQVKAWYAATDILNSAGLRNEGIAPQRAAVSTHQISMQELVIEEVDESRNRDTSSGQEESSGRNGTERNNILPPIRGARPYIGSDDEQ